ncbi:MAG: ABC transporter substrate-binding protein [Planctomycetota bacterium]|jgi:multiple sugar transport system substrate-binding protein
MATEAKKGFLVLALCGAALIVLATLWWSGQEKKAPAAPPAPRPPAASSPDTTITICALKDHSFEVALKLLKDSNFEERNGITVKAILLEFAPMVKAHELSFSSQGNGYDLVSIDQPSLGRYVENGWVQPLSPFLRDPSLPSIDADDIVPVLREACGTWQGTLYAVPLGSYGALLAYRTDLFTEKEFAPPKSFAEFLTQARAFNKPPSRYGTALFAHLGEYITADAAPFLWSWGSGLINGCDVTLPNRPRYRAAWDTPEGIAALEFYARLYREKLAPPDTLQYDHARYISAFQSGRVVMGIMPAEGIGAPMEDATASKVVGKIAYATLPGKRQADGTLGPPRAGLGAHSLAISKGSAHPKAAYQVLQFLTAQTIGQDYIRLGGRPFRNSHFTPKAIAAAPYLAAIRDGMKTGRCRPNIPEYPAVSKIFFTAFHGALTHNAPIAEVMRAAAAKANREVLAPAYPESSGERDD